LTLCRGPDNVQAGVAADIVCLTFCRRRRSIADGKHNGVGGSIEERFVVKSERSERKVGRGVVDANSMPEAQSKVIEVIALNNMVSTALQDRPHCTFRRYIHC